MGGHGCGRPPVPRECLPTLELRRYPKQLALGRPVVAEANATRSWETSPTTQTGVITYAPHTDLGGTAIVIVAFDPSDRSIKFANSWGVNWGENSFGTMSAEVASHVLGDTWALEVPPPKPQ